MTIKDTPIKKYFTSHYSAFSAKRQTNFVFIVFHELSQENQRLLAAAAVRNGRL